MEGPGTGGRAPAVRRPAEDGPLRPAGMHELEELLAEHLATRVRVQEGRAGGKVIIEFADLDDLERIYRAMTEPPNEPITSLGDVPDDCGWTSIGG